MTIVIDKNVVPYNDIPFGSVFATDGEDFYIKTEILYNPKSEEDVTYYSIRLRDGKSIIFDSNAKVIRVNCELHIK